MILVVTKPQAVITVATSYDHSTSGVTITVTKPQAVITVATVADNGKKEKSLESYKTASGNHCCNFEQITSKETDILVTKPQAVITVATYADQRNDWYEVLVTKPQAVITVATSITLN